MSYEKIQSFRIVQRYVWFENASMIVKMYFLNGVPFTFDELPVGHLYDQDLTAEADKHRDYDQEDVYIGSNYLLMEECHPCFNVFDIENPEDLPDDDDLPWDEEDLTN